MMTDDELRALVTAEPWVDDMDPLRLIVLSLLDRLADANAQRDQAIKQRDAAEIVLGDHQNTYLEATKERDAAKVSLALSERVSEERFILWKDARAALEPWIATHDQANKDERAAKHDLAVARMERDEAITARVLLRRHVNEVVAVASSLGLNEAEALDFMLEGPDGLTATRDQALRARDEALAALEIQTRRLDDALKAADPQELAAGAVEAQRRAEVERDEARSKLALCEEGASEHQRWTVAKVTQHLEERDAARELLREAVKFVLNVSWCERAEQALRSVETRDGPDTDDPATLQMLFDLGSKDDEIRSLRAALAEAKGRGDELLRLAQEIHEARAVIISDMATVHGKLSAERDDARTERAIMEIERDAACALAVSTAADRDHARTLHAQAERDLCASAQEAQTLLERIAALEVMHTPWPLTDFVKRLVEGADHLLSDHACDAHGYENLMGARDAARAWLEKRGQR